MNDDLKIAINLMQDRIVSDYDDILLIFDNQTELNKYKKNHVKKSIIKKYKELKSCNKVAKLFNMTGENVRGILIRNNVERKKGGNNDLFS